MPHGLKVGKDSLEIVDIFRYLGLCDLFCFVLLF